MRVRFAAAALDSLVFAFFFAAPAAAVVVKREKWKKANGSARVAVIECGKSVGSLIFISKQPPLPVTKYVMLSLTCTLFSSLYTISVFLYVQSSLILSH